MTTNEYLEQMLRPLADSFSTEFARKLVDLRAAPELQDRVDELAGKANDGMLTDEERAEYQARIRAATLVAVMQAQARRFLSQRPA